MTTLLIAGALFYLPDLVLMLIIKQAQRGDLPRPARRARLDGRVRRSRPGA